MADVMEIFEKKSAEFCTYLQNEIDNNRYLSDQRKQQFRDMLQECADQSKKYQDKELAFNQGLQEINQKFFMTTGSNLIRKPFEVRSIA
ncbi:hypothetical protein [Dyadobacter psychrophilus]|uniref:Uncharacterized protein n=1 Tax=Dyadobacter psychrophilus TaxID=651661 RepID=A0A1T5BLC6_9BACT|nr:hypothetical protein [Dyadobacter psychrophilus]SKB47623.1 hypothetical protein SAMN05660293_00417 [Dyadobacter psychrophilus]